MEPLLQLFTNQPPLLLALFQVDPRKMDQEALAKALKQLLQDPLYAAKAAAIGATLRSESGPAKAAALIADFACAPATADAPADGQEQQQQGDQLKQAGQKLLTERPQDDTRMVVDAR
jgi:hypothetical protein